MDEFRKKYSLLGARYILHEEFPIVYKTKEMKGYVEKMLAAYEDYRKDTADFRKFASFDSLDQEIHKRMEDVFLDCLNYIQKSITTEEGKAARKIHKTFQEFLKKFHHHVHTTEKRIQEEERIVIKATDQLKIATKKEEMVDAAVVSAIGAGVISGATVAVLPVGLLTSLGGLATTISAYAAANLPTALVGPITPIITSALGASVLSPVGFGVGIGMLAGSYSYATEKRMTSLSEFLDNLDILESLKLR